MIHAIGEGDAVPVVLFTHEASSLYFLFAMNDSVSASTELTKC
jgi:hypothetical protein